MESVHFCSELWADDDVDDDESVGVEAESEADHQRCSDSHLTKKSGGFLSQYRPHHWETAWTVHSELHLREELVHP